MNHFYIALTGFDDYFRGSNERIISHNIVLAVCYGEQRRYGSIKIIMLEAVHCSDDLICNVAVTYY